MSTITKEKAKDLRNAFECWQQDYDPVEDKEQHDMFGLGVVAMDALLASLEADDSGRNPVLAYADSYRDMAKQGVESIPVWSVITDLERNIAPLFTAPPAPVSVPDEVSWEDVPEDITEDDMALASAWAHGFNQCRAAMLQGADGALTDEDTKRVDELVMWIKRLAHSLRKSNPDSKLQSDAMDYLSRKGLISVKDILR